MRRNTMPRAASQACWSSCPDASGLCLRVAAPAYSWMLEAGGCWEGRDGRSEGVMQLRLLDTPLAPDKPLWTSQAAYNKQAGCCRQALSRGSAVGGWGEHVLTANQGGFFWLVKVFNWNFSSNCPNWLCFPFIFSPLQTWERTLRRSPRVKRWHWTRRCCCAVIPPRECHKPRWGSDTGVIYRSVSIYPFLTRRTKCKK